MKKRGFETQTSFTKHITVGCEIRNTKIVTLSGKTDDCAGEKNHLGISYYFMSFKIDKYLSPTTVAENNNHTVEFIQPTVKNCQIAFAGYERAFP